MDVGREEYIRFHHNVHFLKTDPKARYQGYSFYFREGFCWNNNLNPQARLLKTRLKSSSVNDVGAMALYPQEIVNSSFCTLLLNSNLIFDYYREFINCTVNIQINDIRQIPIVIPNKQQLNEAQMLVSKAVMCSKQRNYKNPEASKNVTSEFQEIIDAFVNNLYGIKFKN